MRCHKRQLTRSAVLNVAESKRKNVINAKMCVHGPPASLTEEVGMVLAWGGEWGFQLFLRK